MDIVYQRKLASGKLLRIFGHGPADWKLYDTEPPADPTIRIRDLHERNSDDLKQIVCDMIRPRLLYLTPWALSKEDVQLIYDTQPFVEKPFVHPAFRKGQIREFAICLRAAVRTQDTKNGTPDAHRPRREDIEHQEREKQSAFPRLNEIAHWTRTAAGWCVYSPDGKTGDVVEVSKRDSTSDMQTLGSEVCAHVFNVVQNTEQVK